MTDTSVLVIEDEENLVEVLRYNLEREGYQVFSSHDGVQGLETARKANPDLVILDVMLPSLDGLEICRILRRESDVPILMLTAKGEEIDRVVGLELGADDYMTTTAQPSAGAGNLVIRIMPHWPGAEYFVLSGAGAWLSGCGHGFPPCSSFY